jgi:hypothetical protein
MARPSTYKRKERTRPQTKSAQKPQCKEFQVPARNNSPLTSSSADRDCADVSLSLSIFERKRPDPAERGFHNQVDATPFAICVANLARSLERQVRNGRLSQDEADKKFADYCQQQFELPPGIVINPTRGQVDIACRDLGIEPPPPGPSSKAWFSPVFMSAQYSEFSGTARYEISRPGVSQKFLREQGIVRVSNEQAQELLGFVCHYDCSGIWIPYHSPFVAGPLIVNGRPFGRVRLDNATKGAKYLSPEEQRRAALCPTEWRSIWKRIGHLRGRI